MLDLDNAKIYKKPVKILQDLIRFDTTNPPGNEEGCIIYIKDLLDKAGFETKIITKTPKRPNIITRLNGIKKSPPLLLYGHIDVVTTKNQKWKYPPFDGAVREGCVWGRGALDMKGGIAMMLAALIRMKAEGPSPPGDIILAIVSDEEQGGNHGSRYLTEEHDYLFKGIKYAISELGGFTFYLGGKRFYPIRIAEKRSCHIRVAIKGLSGHGSMPSSDGVSARLGILLNRLTTSSLPVHIDPVARMQIKGMASVLPFPSSLIISLLLNPLFTNKILKLLGRKGKILDPILHNTVNITSIHGGEQSYGLPGRIDIGLAATLLPGFGSDAILSELKEIIGEEFELEVNMSDHPPPEIDMGLFKILKEVLYETDPGGNAIPMLLPSPTDGRYFSKLGIQTYGFLPMALPERFDFTTMIHSSNERIPLEAIKFGTDSIYSLLQRFI
jgi:acetylornithine deacetylase/succinyl-diaminopimelate desuccinylase-like protein